MKTKGENHYFYNSKKQLYPPLILFVSGMIVAISCMDTCLPNRVHFMLGFIVCLIMSIFYAKKIIQSDLPIATINSRGLKYGHEIFSWDDIKKIYMKPYGWGLHFHVRSCITPLMIETKYLTRGIVFYFMSDKERRCLLNAIEKYKSVEYIGCKYTGNYANMNFMAYAVVLFMGFIVLLANLFVNEQSPIEIKLIFVAIFIGIFCWYVFWAIHSLLEYK